MTSSFFTPRAQSFSRHPGSGPAGRSGKWGGRGLAILTLVATLVPGNLVGANRADLVILHTNDVHDHVRPGYNGSGGLPYVSGYVHAVREEETNVLVLDAGDVTEKGDQVAHVVGGELTYRAMRRVGYDAVTIGNHDNDAGLDVLRRYEEALGQSLLCLNRVDGTGESLFPGSRVLKIGEVRVGIIGLMVPQDSGTLDQAASGRALAAESERLRGTVDLLIALCHESAEECRQWSLEAPEIDLFVTGHSHHPLEAPVQVSETGAWMVQAGFYASAVGRVDLEVDLDKGGIAAIDGRLVEMRHEAIPVDRAMMDWVAEEEKTHCPEASEFLFDNSELLSGEALAWLGAEALRRAAGTEIAFCHEGQVIRDRLPLGPVDVNAVFLTGGFRADENLLFRLTGREVESYIKALAAEGREPTRWSGFTARTVKGVFGDLSVVSDLEPDRAYSVIMPEIEWRTRFMRMVRRHRERGVAGPLADVAVDPLESQVTFTDAMTVFLARIAGNGWSLQGVADEIRNGIGPGG